MSTDTASWTVLGPPRRGVRKRRDGVVRRPDTHCRCLPGAEKDRPVAVTAIVVITAVNISAGCRALWP